MIKDGRAEWSWENDMKPMEPLQVKPHRSYWDSQSSQHGNFTIIPCRFHGSNSFPPPLLPVGLKGCQMGMIRMMYHLLSKVLGVISLPQVDRENTRKSEYSTQRNDGIAWVPHSSRLSRLTSLGPPSLRHRCP